MDELSYRSYCWVMGTTSFRMTEMNRKIEAQLSYLDEFWAKPGMGGVQWSANNAIQEDYYRFLRDKGFVTGDAPRPDKDAREKTSGLVEMGLIDEERRITPAGREILDISRSGDFTDDGNVLELPRDSYRYLLQLLKGSKTTGECHVRPFVVFLRVMLSVRADPNGRRHLTWDEFGKLLPLCIDETTTQSVVARINAARERCEDVDVDAVISDIVLAKPNYRAGMRMLLNATVVDEDLICDVGINRKSRQYDKVYFPVYTALHDLAFHGFSRDAVVKFAVALEKLKGNVPALWKRYFFALAPGGRIPRNPVCQLNRSLKIFNISGEREFRGEFYRLLQLFKAKATLEDYADLNRRYFSLSDAVIFRDGEVLLDEMPRALFQGFVERIKSFAFLKCDNAGEVVSMSSLLGGAIPAKDELFMSASGMNAEEVQSRGGLRKAMHDRRYSSFRGFLHTRFPRTQIARLLRKFEDRSNDADLQRAVTDAADIPTIFEYVVGLAWYYISGETGDVLEYLNLSLGADFLPKSHAGGGTADILWRYDSLPPAYERHALLVEVTLAEKDSQRRLEMEPVSRHLGDYLIDHPSDRKSYCTFVTTALNPNVISDFRGKRSQIYYDPSDTSKKVYGLKIIPIETKVLSEIVERNMTYRDVYGIFERHYSSEGEPMDWYRNLVQAVADNR